MVYRCIVKGCENKHRWYSAVMFHRIPTHHKRRKVWLAAMNMDLMTPVQMLKNWRVCSDHFTPEDYTSTGLRLKDTAIPTIFKTPPEQSAASTSAAKLSDVQQDLPKREDSFFVGVPHSAPQEHRADASAAGFKEPLSVHITSKPAAAPAPTSTRQSDSASSSTMMATCSQRKSLVFEQEPHLMASTVTALRATSVSDVSMSSVSPTDTSSVPYPSPSTSTTGSTSSPSGQPRAWKERKWIVNESKLMELFQKCTTCGAAMCDLNKTITKFGSRLHINWQCNNGHTGQWESCPNVSGMAENNLLAAAATLFTGSTYPDITDWAGLLNLQLPQQTAFYNIQASYLLPAIEEAYTEQENAIKARLIFQTEDGEGVQLCGDGRSDSADHSSKYLTYSLMDDSTNQIVAFETLQVPQESSSVEMEPLGFRKGLEKILDEGIDVKAVTTDRHPSIRKTMREEYPHIIHEFDPWQVTKGLKEKLVAASNRMDCKDLAPWVRSITNHMWWSCWSSRGDAKELHRRWTSLLHHITGVHRWEENGTQHKCFHQDLSAEDQRGKKWLKVDSPAFKALEAVIMDNSLLKDLQQMAWFKHTGQFEVFHNTLLKYYPKRLHCQHPAMKARTMLAIMDHNQNHATKRRQATTAAGLPRHSVVFQKQSKIWVARPVYEETTHTFRDDLFERVIRRRLDTAVRFREASAKRRSYSHTPPDSKVRRSHCNSHS